MSTFTLNGNSVVAKKFDFNALCELDNYGVSIQDMTNKPFAFIRAYIAYSMGLSLDDAGNEVEKHIENGGKLDEMFRIINKELEESGFFRALQNEPEEIQKETPTSKRKTKQ